MKKNIFIKLFISFVILVLINVTFSAISMQNRYEKQLRENIVQDLKLISKSDNSVAYHNPYRITIIEENGTVVLDTQKDNEILENHYDRPEIQAALDAGFGEAVRFSTTMQKEMFYIAIADNGMIYRAAVPYSNISHSFINQIPTLGGSVILSILVALFLSKIFTDSTLRPLERINKQLQKATVGEIEQNISADKYFEIAEVNKNINLLAQDISKKIADVEEEREKLTYILDNINQGIVVLNFKRRIEHCNSYAKLLFNNNSNIINKEITYLIRDKEFARKIYDCLDHKNNKLFDCYLNEQLYSVLISYIEDSWLEKGCMILFTNVTKERDTEKIRKEFIANASHELKTPITTIQGFSELLSNGMVDDEKQKQDYLNRIIKQTQNMTEIINDIIVLSQVDEEEKPKIIQSFNFKEESERIISKFYLLSKTKNISINLNCDDKLTDIIYKDHFNQLLSNLLSNAIKYNIKNGFIDININETKNQLIIGVSDSGKGIKKSNIDRIFERFYRGQTEEEGSGIGLAIVKHIVATYDGKISIDSSEKGTKFEVVINRI